VVDTTGNENNRGSQALGWILCLLFAVIAATGWYQYRQASAETQNLAHVSEAQIQDLETSVRQLQRNNDRLQSEKAETQSLVDIGKAKINDLETSVQQLRQTNDQLQTELAAERATRQQEISKLTASSAELESELQQRLAQQESLNRQVSEASDEKQQLASRLDEAQTRRQQLLDRIAEVSGDVEAKEAALTEAGQDISRLNQQLEQNLAQQEALEARIRQLNEQQRQEAQQFADLKQNLEQELKESQVKITQLKNRMTVINLTSEVLFASGSARITATGKQLLDVIAASLNAYPDREISIEGHTDNVPVGKNSRFASNWELSTARAQAAVDYLQQHADVAPERLQVVGHGEHRPVASNETPEGRRLNRRIEIRLLPTGEVSV